MTHFFRINKYKYKKCYFRHTGLNPNEPKLFQMTKKSRLLHEVRLMIKKIYRFKVYVNLEFFFLIKTDFFHIKIATNFHPFNSVLLTLLKVFSMEGDKTNLRFLLLVSSKKILLK